jgi:hypothetical protein
MKKASLKKLLKNISPQTFIEKVPIDLLALISRY